MLPILGLLPGAAPISTLLSDACVAAGARGSGGCTWFGSAGPEGFGVKKRFGESKKVRGIQKVR